MITAVFLAIFHSFGFIVFLLGIQSMIFLPLTLVYELWKKRFLKGMPIFNSRISILVPAYNEEKTLRATVLSILDSDYPDKEIIVINDGSTDKTEEKIRDIIDEGKIIYISKPNGGKASALNKGIDAVTGDVVIFTDADSLFLTDTISKMARWFGDHSIDAVCGNDEPLNPATPIQKFLTITTHIGTGFVRRALSVIGCLPIITGNLGAIRTSVLREIKGFREIWGEDLEVTFRLHKYRKRVIFDPEPKVIAECPGTAKALWKQRTRWMRSYIKIIFLHKDLFFKPRFRPFSFYLPINFMNMTLIPLIQVSLVAVLPYAFATKYIYITDTMEVLTYLGLIFFFVIAVYSIILDREYHDMVYLPYGLLIVPMSFFFNAVVAYSWWKEIQKAEEKWEKIERRKIVQIGGREIKGWKVAVVALFLVVFSSATTYFFVTTFYFKKDLQVYNMKQQLSQATKPAFHLALSTHFDAWPDWKDALRNVLNRPKIGMSEVIGVGAGRPEWVYFRWTGHERDWANHQKGERDDLLLKAVETFHRAGFKVAAIIDLYAPKYIKRHPEAAAVRFDGEKSHEQISLMEIVEGDYGKVVLDMIDNVSKNYPVEIINLTELSFYSYSFNDKDLISYKAYSGRQGWPLDRRGKIDKEDPSVWEWKSEMMERFIKKVADIVHSYGKELYVDVPVSWRDFTQNARESGLDYRRILNHADKIIVWDYYYLENAPPVISEALSQHLVKNFPISTFYVSIGLWGKKKPVDAESFAEAVTSTLRGGATQIWVTPNDLISEKHWDKLLPYWREEKQ